MRCYGNSFEIHQELICTSVDTPGLLLRSLPAWRILVPLLLVISSFMFTFFLLCSLRSPPPFQVPWMKMWDYSVLPGHVVEPRPIGSLHCCQEKFMEAYEGGTWGVCVCGWEWVTEGKRLSERDAIRYRSPDLEHLTFSAPFGSNGIGSRKCFQLHCKDTRNWILCSQDVNFCERIMDSGRQT